jgi:FtsP/CotA-like multicopper oxidase with cupredoxin domain
MAAAVGNQVRATAPAGNESRLVATAARWPLVGEARLLTDVWCYANGVPGPELRVKQGEPIRITVRNDLPEETTVHWHGIRLPNAMDGVPNLTQSPIRPGGEFIYEFTPPDAGTFWYHPHTDILRQLGRGLAGALIVEEPDAIAVDRELVWMLADWRLTNDAQIAPGFGNTMDAAMSGRIGNIVTINGGVSREVTVKAGERIRLRLINAALARIMALRFDGHRPVVVALDGQPCEPHAVDRVVLGPAMRTDLVLDMQGEPGRRYGVSDDFYDESSYRLTELAYDPASSARTRPFDPPAALPRNRLPEPDLASAERHQLVLQGGMMGMMGGGMMGMRGGMMGGGMMNMHGGMMGMQGASWAINGTSITGDGSAGMPPLLTLKLGRTYEFAIRNDTAWWHPIHLHGHSFRVLRRDSAPVPHQQWADTVLVAPNETVDIAFVADNPGDWMLHCHVADHQVAGMMTVLRVG